MTRGAVFFAFNTSSIDYVRIAEWNARLVNRHLNLPVTLITDTPVASAVFDQVILTDNNIADQRIFFDQDTLVPWRNRGRCTAYDLSPYDETLLLDVDYIVASNQLTKLFDDRRDFICYQRAIDAIQDMQPPTTIGEHRLPMSWATMIKFNRSTISKQIFDIMAMVQNNYSHYADLYKFRHAPFRNDYALSIALSITSGHLINSEFDCHWPLINVSPAHEVGWIGEDHYEIKYTKLVNNEPKPFNITVRNQDLHIMGKSYLEHIVETY